MRTFELCGEGISGVNVKHPRLNPFLLADKVGVVQIAVGGMHCVALMITKS
jgi:regulator of chromosome condensation